MIFIDAGAFIARHRESDDWHEAAVRGWRELSRSSNKLFTSNFVIIEAADVLASIRGPRWVAEHASGWLQSRELQVLRATAEDELQATEMLRKFSDHEIGLSDCVSFALMRRMHIRRAFAFDRHFKIAGFTLWPNVAR